MIVPGALFNAIMALALLLLAWGFAQFLVWYRCACPSTTTAWSS